MRPLPYFPLLTFSSILSVGLCIAQAAEAKEECTRIYAACMEEANKLPGSISDPESPFHKAWRACASGEAHTCEFGAPASSAPRVQPDASVQRAAKADLVATVKSFKGDVEVQKGNGDFVTLKEGQQVTLQPGDSIGTGLDSFATLTFNDGQDGIDVYHMTELRIDDTLVKKNRAQTQMSLRVGSIKVFVKHTAAIRGDFSVNTPTCNSSIRGSAMVVRYDDKQNITTVYVTEDKAYVKSTTKSAKEITVKQGRKVTVGADGIVSKPQKFSADEVLGNKSAKPVVQTQGKPSKVSLPGTSPTSGSTALTRFPVVATRASAEAEGFPVKNATDNSPTSMWVASTQVLTANNDVWISLDFGAPKRVQRLKWRASQWENPYPSNGPTKYRIQRSDDGQNWTDIGKVIDLGTDGKNPRQINGEGALDVTARYLRLKVERVNDGTGWSLGLKDFWAEGRE